MNATEVLERIYGAWLGKLIGIRLGAPIEGWTHEQIMRTYGAIDGYVVDYGHFSADDDANGPLYLSRILLEHPDGYVSAEQMGDHLLDVTCDHLGFFWWGGTEAAAYDNLKAGLQAPASGSIAVNGPVAAQQIGGQIFSDCWGYVSMGDVKRAMRWAARMASVTHDGLALDGARFIAACIALAWHEKSMPTIIRQAARAIGPGPYRDMVLDVSAMWRTDRDPEVTLAAILDKYGYQRYQGACPLLPNAAIVVYGLLYGRGSFDATMRLIAQAGYDTDCNLGNAGSIAGMAYGLAAISPRWITPYNDLLVASGSVGAANLAPISASARMMAAMACRLNRIPVTDGWADMTGFKADFSLPYATNGFAGSPAAGRQIGVAADAGRLKAVIGKGLAGQVGQIERPCLLKPDDIYDDRYQPQFTSPLTAGTTVFFQTANPDRLPIEMTAYVRGYDGIEHLGLSRDGGLCSVTVPADVCEPVAAVGLKVRFIQEVRHGVFFVSAVHADRRAHAVFDFTRWPMEQRGSRRAIAGMIAHRGVSYVDGTGLHLDQGMVSFGPSDIRYDQLVWRLTWHPAIDAVLAWGVTGSRHLVGLRIHGTDVMAYQQTDGRLEQRMLGSLQPQAGQLTLRIDFTRRRVMAACGRLSAWPAALANRPGALAAVNLNSHPLTVAECRMVRR